GAKNAELALEFGLSPKQVQGFRIGSAREIARRRAHTGNAFEAEQEASPTAIIDDIVRYLRQQDDVVVLQEDGGYLVNGRFRMTASELVTRANRMRTRQRKPAFEIPTRPYLLARQLRQAIHCSGKSRPRTSPS